MGTFSNETINSNETIKWLSIGLGIVVALYLMIPMAQVPLYADGVRKSGLRIGIEGRLHFLGIIYSGPNARAASFAGLYCQR